MLEFINKYFIKEITDLKDFITVIYILIDDIYQETTSAHIKERRNIKDAILSDSEIITIHTVIDEIRKQLNCILGYPYESVRIIDSIPIPVCKFGRAHFHKSFKVDAAYGYCASKK